MNTSRIVYWTPLALALTLSLNLAEARAQQAGAPASATASAPAGAGATQGATANTGNAAVGQGQSALPLVQVPDVADAGLADVRNRAAGEIAPLSLEEAVGLALQNNPSPKAARAVLDAALARIGVARAAGGPQLTLNGSVSSQRYYGSANNPTNGDDILGYNTNESLSLNATLPIYNGGRVKASRRAAEAQARAQLASAQQTEQDLAAQTILAYLSVLQNQQLLDVAESNLATSRERRRVAGVRFDAGAAARLEVLRADSDLATARQRRIAAANNVAQSKAILNILLARDPETPINPEPIASLTIAAGATTPPAGGVLALPAVARFPLAAEATAIAGGGAIPTSASLRTTAQAGLPSLQSTRESIEAANQNLALQKAQKKPNISASLGGALRNPVGGLGRFLVSIGLGLAQTVFDSGRIRSQVNEAEAQVQQVRFNLNSQELQVANVIESALLQLDSARKRQNSADVSVLTAQEALRAAQLAYAAGAGTNLEVTDAQNALLVAQTDAVNARFEVAQAQVQLAAATSQTSTGRSTGANTGSTFSSSSTGTSTGVSTVSTTSSSSSTGTSGSSGAGNAQAGN